MTTATSPRPDQAYIQRTAAHLEELWSEAHSEMREVDSYIQGEYQLWAKGTNRAQYRPPTALRIVNNAANVMLASEPTKIHRNPVAEGGEHQERADKVEPWVRAFLEEASKLETQPPFVIAKKNLVRYGYAVAYGPTLDYSARPQEPTTREATESVARYDRRYAAWKRDRTRWMPFRIRAPHPAQVLMNPLEARPTEAVYRYVDLAKNLEARTKRNEQRGRTVRRYEAGENPYERVKCMEYFSLDWHALTLENGDILMIERNTWGFIPFAHAFSGWGHIPTPSDVESFNPKYMAVGMLPKPVRDALKVQAQEKSAKHNVTVAASFLTMRSKKPPVEAAQELARAQQTNTVVEGTEGDWGYIPLPEIPAQVFQTGEETDRDITLATYSQTDVHDAGVETVGQQALLNEAANKTFDNPARMMGYMGSQVISNGLRLLDVLDEPITINGNKLSPDDLEGDFNITVEFKRVDPAIHMAGVEEAERHYGLGLISSREFYEKAGYENPTQIDKNLIKDILRKHPALLDQDIKTVAAEDGTDKIIERWEAQQEALAAAGGGTGGQKALPAPKSSGKKSTKKAPRSPGEAVESMTANMTPNGLRSENLPRQVGG